MPHSTNSGGGRRTSVSTSHYLPPKPLHISTLMPNESFPRLDPDQFGTSSARTPSPTAPGFGNNNGVPSERWQARKDPGISWSNGALKPPHTHTRHGRQKSLTDAIKTIRSRRGSVTENAHEIAEALKVPVSPRLISLCLVWYMTSALTNTSSKSILNAFRKPVTLTVIQFAFVSTWCIFFAYLARLYPSLRTKIPALRNGIRPPTREVLMTTLPLAVFQVGGHILSSTATSKIPVSLVHTIKGLSPLFTVLAYRLFFRARYSVATYLSLIPLTLGVVLACSADFSGNFFGVLCAFGGAIIFVTQNIFSKRLFNEAARADADGQQQRSHKLDKLNLLCYSSGMAFLLTAPLWLWSEGFSLIGDFFHDGALDLSGRQDALKPGRLMLEFFFNGTFHFGQNIIAFVLLSMVSPVTYSVASLVKRIFVIVVAVVWFGNSTTPIQAVGIGLTFIGLYLYDRTSDAAKADRKVKMDQMKDQPLLPLLEKQSNSFTPVFSDSPLAATAGHFFGGVGGGVHGYPTEEKRASDVGPGRPRGESSATNWLAPGIRQEETWRPRDAMVGSALTTS